MDILQLIDRLEELFNDGKPIPFTHNVAVDEDRMLDIIDQMRIAIPDEVKKAQQLLSQRDRVMAQARDEAEATRQDADDYVVDTLGRMQDELESSLNQVRNGIRKLEEDRMRRAAPIPPNPAPAPTENPDEEKER